VMCSSMATVLRSHDCWLRTTFSFTEFLSAEAVQGKILPATLDCLADTVQW